MDWKLDTVLAREGWTRVESWPNVEMARNEFRTNNRWLAAHCIGGKRTDGGTAQWTTEGDGPVEIWRPSDEYLDVDYQGRKRAHQGILIVRRASDRKPVRINLLDGGYGKRGVTVSEACREIERQGVTGHTKREGIKAHYAQQRSEADAEYARRQALVEDAKELLMESGFDGIAETLRASRHGHSVVAVDIEQFLALCRAVHQGAMA